VCLRLIPNGTEIPTSAAGYNIASGDDAVLRSYITYAAVPEPATVALAAGVGAILFVAVRRRRGGRC
jgi:hypothetical protein